MVFSNPWRHRRYFTEKWTGILREFGAGRALTMLEVGAGASVILPKVLADYNDKSSYVTANVNLALTRQFRRRTAKLPIKVDAIEDDAARINDHLAPESVDVLAFEHSMNDIFQAILLGKDGINTARGNWFALLPAMIARMNEVYRGGRMEAELKAPFMELLNNCVGVLKRGGLLALSHYMFQYDLKLGYDPYLWANMLPMVRPWLLELPGGREVSLEGYEDQWWFFWEKS